MPQPPKKMRVVAYRYRVSNSHRDDYVVSTRMATPEKIERIRGEPIQGSQAMIDETHLLDGWTGRVLSFDKARPPRPSQNKTGRAALAATPPHKWPSLPQGHWANQCKDHCNSNGDACRCQ